MLRKSMRARLWAEALGTIIAIMAGDPAPVLAQSITYCPLPASVGATVTGLRWGADGNLWFTENDVGKIGRMSPTGAVTEFALPTANSSPVSITLGPDGNMWFTEQVGNK